MLRFLFKVIIVLLIVSGLAYYASYLMTGKTPGIGVSKLPITNINLSKLTDNISKKIKSVREGEPAKDTSLYKWRDAKGVMHYVSEKPSEEINYEEIILRNHTNLVPAISENKAKDEKPTQQLPTPASPENIYSPEGIKELFDQAHDVQNQMNEQFEQTENRSYFE